jgi:hypothetical protein
MTTQATSRWRIALSTRLLDDATRANLLAGIQDVAKQSQLAQNPAIAASLSALAAKGAALATAVAGTAMLDKQLKAMTSQRDQARAAFDRELVALKSAVESAAQNEGDATGMGFKVLVAGKPTKAPPDPPAALMVKTGRAHGKARVTVAPGGTCRRFAAEVSADPTGAGPWSPLPGTGRQRELTGYATGTKLWVRFAAVRYGMQSDWCTPVLVTIP